MVNTKKIKKSEIAVYAISLMLVAAGYFNFMNFNNEKTKEVYSENIENSEYANVGDAVLVSNSEADAEIEEDEEEKKEEEKDNNTNESTEQTNTNITDENKDENYYASSKMDREKMYAEMISNYEAIIGNDQVTEVQKNIAIQEITKINNTKNAIMICENLILTKGFNNCVIFINEDSVNVVINITGGLKEDSVAKIQNIISRELNTQIQNIHITEK